MEPNPDDKSLPTIWRVPDAMWQMIEPILLELDPPAKTGRKRISSRDALDTLIFRLRTSCQWNHLPKDLPDDSSVHRAFQRWIAKGILDRIWATLTTACAELGGLDWQWQAADAAMNKARMGGDKIGRNPTDRGKRGSKRSLLVEAAGGPLAVVVEAANRHDTKLLDATIEAIVVDRPEPSEAEPQHLCLDKAYDNPTGAAAIKKHRYTGHVRRIGEEKFDENKEKRHPARRWVVERTLAWLSKCRAILVRYDKKSENYLGLIQLACALLWYRRHHTLSVLR